MLALTATHSLLLVEADASECCPADSTHLAASTGDEAALAETLIAGTVPTNWIAGLVLLLLVVLAVSAFARLGRQRQRSPLHPPLRPAPNSGAHIDLPAARPTPSEVSGKILDALNNAEQTLSQIRLWLEEDSSSSREPARGARRTDDVVSFADQPATRSADEVFLERVHSVIARSLHDECFNVTALAQEVGVDRSHLYRRLHALIDQSPSDLIRACRLEHAAKLLHHRTGTVSEIAHQVGFKSVAHFSHSFREHFQMPPSAYGRETES